MRRLLRLLLGLWSPSRVMLLACRDVRRVAAAQANGQPIPYPSPLGWLDRWELRNYESHVAAGGPGLAPEAEIAEGLALGAMMMDFSVDPKDWPAEAKRRGLRWPR